MYEMHNTSTLVRKIHNGSSFSHRRIWIHRSFSHPGGASATALEYQKPERYLTPDQQFDLILRKLESLPEHLKKANPKTYPNYEAEIRRYVGDTKLVTQPSVVKKPGQSPQFNAWACAGSLAGFVVSTGIPVTKIIGWIKKARAIWGGVRGIMTAIRSGVAATEIGGEAATVLMEILGAGGVVQNCFN